MGAAAPPRLDVRVHSNNRFNCHVPGNNLDGPTTREALQGGSIETGDQIAKPVYPDHFSDDLIRLYARLRRGDLDPFADRRAECRNLRASGQPSGDRREPVTPFEG